MGEMMAGLAHEHRVKLVGDERLADLKAVQMHGLGHTLAGIPFALPGARMPVGSFIKLVGRFALLIAGAGDERAGRNFDDLQVGYVSTARGDTGQGPTGRSCNQDMPEFHALLR